MCAEEAPKDEPQRIRRVERNEAGQIVLYMEGRREPIDDARVARSFPWTFPDSYISIRTAEGKEIALLKSLDELPAGSREVLEQELRDKVFNPKIRRIIEWKSEFGVTSIQAETDRGEVSFQIRSRDDIRALSPTRALFRDVDGNTYELPDLTKLDPTSQKRLQQYF